MTTIPSLSNPTERRIDLAGLICAVLWQPCLSIPQGSYANGVGYGGVSISISRDGQEPITEHGKWIAVDTSETSEADKETIASFNKLMNTLGAKDEIEVIHYLRIVADIADLVANNVQSDVKDN